MVPAGIVSLRTASFSLLLRSRGILLQPRLVTFKRAHLLAGLLNVRGEASVALLQRTDLLLKSGQQLLPGLLLNGGLEGAGFHLVELALELPALVPMLRGSVTDVFRLNGCLLQLGLELDDLLLLLVYTHVGPGELLLQFAQLSVDRVQILLGGTPEKPHAGPRENKGHRTDDPDHMNKTLHGRNLPG